MTQYASAPSPRLFRLSKAPGLNRWKNPMRRQQLLSRRLVQASMTQMGL